MAVVVTGHISKKLHSIILQYYQSLLMFIVPGVVQSCSGDVRHQSSHIHLPGIECFFIKGVSNCTLIISDKSRPRIKAISGFKSGIVCCVVAGVICSLSLLNKKSVKAVAAPGKVSANDVDSSAATKKKKKRTRLLSIVSTKEGQGRVFSLNEYSSVQRHIWTNYNKSSLKPELSGNNLQSSHFGDY